MRAPKVPWVCSAAWPVFTPPLTYGAVTTAVVLSTETPKTTGRSLLRRLSAA